ncbi:EAL domain-containing protein [Acidithiobacillus ferrivorans]|nr:EAL domain-containing protein [Acidithiobacillus ferrivorans]
MEQQTISATPTPSCMRMEPIVRTDDSTPVAGELLCNARLPHTMMEWRIFYHHFFTQEADAIDHEYPLSFNLDTRHILDDAIWSGVVRFFMAQKKPANWIVEWTEHAEGNHAAAAHRLCDLQSIVGMPISIDDVGAGQDGLSRIAATRPQWIKIDGPLFQKARGDSNIQSLLRGLCAIGRDMGASVIAEWVECPGDLDLARSVGADHAQGFLFRPTKII